MSTELDPDQRVQIFDTTLRDGEQSPGIALDIDEKVSIAKQLTRLGVNIIEAGFPVNSAAEFAAVQAVAQTVEGPTVAALARAHSHDIETAAAAIKDATNPRIHTFISTSDIHIQHQLQSTREDVRGMARAAVAHAKSLVDDVEFSPMDATRANWDYTAEVIQIAVDEGATVINVPDTVGYITPDEYRAYIEFLRREVKGADDITWSVHCHNDLSIAVANAWAGILGGARQVEGTINGIGERAGNTQLEALIMLIKTRGHEFGGLHTDIDTPQLGPTSRLVSRLTGYAIAPNQPVSGRNAFAHEAGIHQDGVLKDASTYEIMDPKSVGWEAEQIIIGKHAGRRAVVSFLEQLPNYSKDAVRYTVDLFNEFRDEQGNVTAEQLTEIHDEAKRRQAAPYRIDRYNVSTSNKARSGSVILRDQTGELHHGTASSQAAEEGIDGAVAAMIAAVADAANVSYKVEDFTHKAIGKGKSTIDQATVTVRVDGRTVSGRGLSTDTVKAAGLAYIDAIRRAKTDNA